MISAGPLKPTLRKAQKDATRAALLAVAVETLIERGVAGVTTLEVQQRAGVSRGALLHHFPTRALLLSATVTELVGLNEAALWREQAALPSGQDPLATAIHGLARLASSPSYGAELELWAVSRTDPELRSTLREVERLAVRERERVLDQLFVCLDGEPARDEVIALTVEISRGLALANLLRRDNQWRDAMIDQWVGAARMILKNKRALGS